ncbi:copper amine oxidase N-terminal domain-containing protein [Paenibacillus oenotherae]|uniref:Copper amine oxidase N-terminal domain-containing protein n=1 Tax=Paenibacillus oenotherae TaxID=1435645 RepID=A0ABS7D5R0_9BACL|nr:copper amine oxidase N-terminal domain-containing protein [Paenibacillus oenotherae]MBW7475166.1 copper amine oxidase N-terminal domain-containing protein [Paenibacillus oenotherae]
MFRKKAIVLAFMMSLFVVGVLPAAQAAPAQAAVKSGAPIPTDVDSIKQAGYSHADMSSVPLFGSREEDRPVLKRLAAILKRIAAKAELYTREEPVDGMESFFGNDVDITFSDGTSTSLTLTHPDTLTFYYADASYRAKDAAAVEELNNMFHNPDQTTISSTTPRIGDKIVLKGNDAGFESGTLTVFLVQGGSYQSFTSVKGVAFPAKRALLIHRAPITHARYNTAFQLPAFGEASDGTLQPVKPGEWSLVYSTGWLQSGREVKIAAPAAPQLSINGVLVSDSAMKPITHQGRIMLPLRSLSVSFGWPVQWDHVNKRVLIGTSAAVAEAEGNKGSGKSISLWVKGKRIKSDTAPIIVKGSVYVPLRTVAEAFGFGIAWTPETRSAHLLFKPALLSVEAYAKDQQQQLIVKAVNDYAAALNARDEKRLAALFSSTAKPAPGLQSIGNRLIVSIRDIKFEARNEGKNMLAYVTFAYLFDENGNTESTQGIVFGLENGNWRILDVD